MWCAGDFPFLFALKSSSWIDTQMKRKTKSFLYRSINCDDWISFPYPPRFIFCLDSFKFYASIELLCWIALLRLLRCDGISSLFEKFETIRERNGCVCFKCCCLSGLRSPYWWLQNRISNSRTTTTVKTTLSMKNACFVNPFGLCKIVCTHTHSHVRRALGLSVDQQLKTKSIAGPDDPKKTKWQKQQKRQTDG